MLSYEEYVIESYRLNNIADLASAKLQEFPSNVCGLTPDCVRNTKAFKDAKCAFSIAMRNCQQFNRYYVGIYGKRRAAERRALRYAKK
jgi:hypothetical protein